MKLTIAGAGMAGLLAARMLAHRNPLVVEAQPCLPNNHSAVLRFRSSIVGDTLGIPFKKVQMIKATLHWRNEVADILAYSTKNTGVARSDRSIAQGTVKEERFIAPPDLIARMAENVSFEFEKPCRFGEQDQGYISTIPMPALMRILDYPNMPKFSSVPGINYRAKIAACDAYASLIVPHPKLPFSRVSITGDELTVEAPNTNLQDDDSKAVIAMAQWLLGLEDHEAWDIQTRGSAYAKILPIPEDERRDFMYWATDKFNIFSLGRFATWRPGLLLDDLVKDIRLIDGWLDRKNRYAAAKHRS